MALSALSSDLISIINGTTFDKSKMKSVCDVDLVFDTTKLKLDHINFKEVNSDKVGNNNSWKVKNHNECDLGKWIDLHKNEKFANSSDWQKLLKFHEDVHSGVQEYIDTDSLDKKDKKLTKIASDIEKNTTEVFNYIDKIKEHKCEELKEMRS